MILLLFILNCSLLFLISFLYYRKIFSAVGFYTIIFILASFCVFITFAGHKEVLYKGYLWITIGSNIFIITFFICQQSLNKKFINKKEKEIVYNLKVVNFLLNICLLILIFSVILSFYEVLPIAKNIKSIFFNSTAVRYQYLAREKKILFSIFGNIFNMTSLFLICLFPIAIENKLKNAKVKLYLSICLRMFSSLLTMSKESLILFLVIFIAAYMDYLSNYKKEIKFLKKNIKYFILIIVIFFTLISIQRSYIGTRYNNYREAIFGTIINYLSIPIISFSELISKKIIEYSYGALSFRPVINLLSYFGLTARIDIKQNLIEGTSSNVYTMFGTMYRDFGFKGIILISIIYGVLCGLIYKKKSNKKLFYLYVNALTVFVFAFSYYDFKFIQTVYVVSILYAAVLEKILKKKLYIKD